MAQIVTYQTLQGRSALKRVMQARGNISFTEQIKQDPVGGETYHIIHPVLKHIAILSCITND